MADQLGLIDYEKMYGADYLYKLSTAHLVEGFKCIDPTQIPKQDFYDYFLRKYGWTYTDIEAIEKNIYTQSQQSKIFDLHIYELLRSI